MAVPALGAVTASIPSPSSGTLSIGPLDLRAYGLMIALGVIAAVWLSGRRFQQLGIGTTDDASSIALWAVPAGVVGARLYHVVTDWQLFRDDPAAIVRIWEGGLGIWGGIAAGVAVGVWVGRRRGLPLGWAVFAVTPSLALAQAIGRWGNWWNQELFGRPTDLPWGLEISPEHRPEGFEQFATFHPTFLYESLWNLLLCLVLVRFGLRLVKRPGALFAWYVAGYTFGRFFLEGLRIDPANTVAGLRVNEWVSLVLFAVAAGFIVRDRLRHRGEPAPVPPAAQPAPAPVDGPDDTSLVDGAGDGENAPAGAGAPVSDEPTGESRP